MRRFIPLSLALAGAFAAQGQVPLQKGLVRGVLVESSVAEFTVRSAPDVTYHFSFDKKTWIERERERISASALKPGELLEVVSDREPKLIRYARLVHVIDNTPKRPPVRTGMYRYFRKSAEPAFQPPLTFTGLAIRTGDGSVIVRTRFDGEQTVYLREDTQYVMSGVQVEPGSLVPNTRVFVSASRNAEGQIEALQVVWGEILRAEPREP